MTYKFRGHETFYLRKGWINKGFKNILKDPYVFMGTNDNPMDVLGIGTNMVKSLRYWMQAYGMTEEVTLNNRKQQKLTKLGEIIYKNDPYVEELGTLCLLHYKLVTNSELATSWYFFFNKFKNKEFNKDDFITQIQSYIRLEFGKEIALRSLEDDFNCIINTYISKLKSTTKKINPENNIDSPLGELGLINVSSKKEKPWIYKKEALNDGDIPSIVALAIILDRSDNKKEIKISSILNEDNNIGKIFNLDTIKLTRLLYSIEKLGYINVIRTAGLDLVRINEDTDFYKLVDLYYKNL